MKKILFFSWKDIDRVLKMHREKWESKIKCIDVYPDGIYVNASVDNDTVMHLFSEVFPRNFDREELMFALDIEAESIPVIMDKSLEWNSSQKKIPLFSKILYSNSSYSEDKLPKLNCPIIAYHSYKGGVGRTLSLLAFAKAWTSEFEDTEHSRILIIDSDIEAPGLTYLNANLSEDTYSYLDLLDSIQDNADIDTIVNIAYQQVRRSTITIETEKRKVEQFFIPTYRYIEQLIDIYASPENIALGYRKEYILAEIISKLGEKLGASVVLVDLRAGLSEYSAPLLFDKRVKKYIVTSTSTQSIKGTEILLRYISKGLLIQKDEILPQIFVTMVTSQLDNSIEMNEIIDNLVACYESDSMKNEDLLDNIAIKMPFASELIHLTSLPQIMKILTQRDMYNVMRTLISKDYKNDSPDESLSEDSRADLLKKINELAEIQITAENNTRFDLMMTEPLWALKNKFCESLPTVVIMGSKGAGKTFVYKEMVRAQTWLRFCNKIDKSELKNDVDRADAIFLPILASKNTLTWNKFLAECIGKINSSIENINVNESIYLTNGTKIQEWLLKERNPVEWMRFWDELLAKSVNVEFESLAELNKLLKEKNKKIVFIIDGLEEIFTKTSAEESEQMGISKLCQDIVNEIDARYPYVGIIVFLRRDIARDSIKVNFAQFEQINKKFTLQWSSVEALRLAVWLITQAQSGIFGDNIDVETASEEIIEECLIKFWGKKLGKSTSNEAYSSRWILAALSDFNGQLQARDIIRFLKMVTDKPMSKPTYNDRYIMPSEIRDTVPKCSKEKISEVKQEYRNLSNIFEKLDELTSEKKIIPFTQNEIRLTPFEEKIMTDEGYLRNLGGEYYIPEIIRHGLNFKYTRGARPKVLSLLLRK